MAYTALAYSYILLITLITIAMLVLSLRPSPANDKTGKYKPKTLVMVPCKGKDLTLEENLRSLKLQDYKNYKLVCIVDNKNDSAVKIINKLKIDFIISNPTYKNCSGKVRAIASAFKRFSNYDAYVIADSDVTFSSGWLSKLLDHLGSGRIGLSTGYPFFNPVGGFWSKVKSAWSTVGEGLLESELTRFGWGGSLAFKKGLINKDDFEFFTNSISDDMALTKIVKQKGFKISYIGTKELTVNIKENYSSFFDWANRQTAFSILDKKIFYFGVAFYSMQILLIISAILLSILYGYIFLLLLLPFISGAIKNYLRLKKRYIEFFPISIMLPFLYLSNLLIAKGLKEVKWRGKIYKIR